jgi:hypothetical protein
MLGYTGTCLRLADRYSRRDLLRIGGAFGLSLADLIRQPVAATTVAPPLGRAKSCIVLFLMGGPSQHNLWDPKPNAPAEVRGEFPPISTAVPGIQIGELLSKTARLTDHLCLLRAMHTGDNAHSSSGYFMMTGVPHQPMNAENVNPGVPNDWPHFGAIVRRLKGDSAAMPAAARLPHRIWNTDGSTWPGQDAGFLGRSNDPWLFRCQPASPDYQIAEFSLPADLPPSRVRGRRSLLANFDHLRSGVEQNGMLNQYDGAARQAFDLLTSPTSRSAFRLDDEPAAVRDRYGRTQFGQSVLLARRLVQAGVRLVQVNWFRSLDEPPDTPCWDSHTREAQRLKTVLAPQFDQAYSALLEDLVQCGLLNETLVVCMSEFGRSPKINAAGGRDHWGNVFSVALAGGGVRGGMVYGASDALGGAPRDGLVRPPDLLATIFHCLGLAPTTELHDRVGRPFPIARGEILRGILA